MDDECGDEVVKLPVYRAIGGVVRSIVGGVEKQSEPEIESICNEERVSEHKSNL